MLITLKAEEKAPKEVVVKKNHFERNALLTKFDNESSSSNNDSNSNNLSYYDEDHTNSEMMRLAALMANSFKKMAYKNFKKGKKFSKNSDKKSFRKAEGNEGISGKLDKSKFKSNNCGEKGHFAPESKKGNANKGQAYIKRKKDWDDTSDSEDEVNYSLMENVIVALKLLR